MEISPVLRILSVNFRSCHLFQWSLCAIPVSLPHTDRFYRARIVQSIQCCFSLNNFCVWSTHWIVMNLFKWLIIRWMKCRFWVQLMTRGTVLCHVQGAWSSESWSHFYPFGQGLKSSAVWPSLRLSSVALSDLITTCSLFRQLSLLWSKSRVIDSSCMQGRNYAP